MAKKFTTPGGGESTGYIYIHHYFTSKHDNIRENGVNSRGEVNEDSMYASIPYELVNITMW